MFTFIYSRKIGWTHLEFQWNFYEMGALLAWNYGLDDGIFHTCELKRLKASIFIILQSLAYLIKKMRFLFAATIVDVIFCY